MRAQTCQEAGRSQQHGDLRRLGERGRHAGVIGPPQRTAVAGAEGEQDTSRRGPAQIVQGGFGLVRCHPPRVVMRRTALPSRLSLAHVSAARFASASVARPSAPATLAITRSASETSAIQAARSAAPRDSAEASLPATACARRGDADSRGNAGLANAIFAATGTRLLSTSLVPDGVVQLSRWRAGWRRCRAAAAAADVALWSVGASWRAPAGRRAVGQRKRNGTVSGGVRHGRPARREPAARPPADHTGVSTDASSSSGGGAPFRRPGLERTLVMSAGISLFMSSGGAPLL